MARKGRKRGPAAGGLLGALAHGVWMALGEHQNNYRDDRDADDARKTRVPMQVKTRSTAM